MFFRISNFLSLICLPFFLTAQVINLNNASFEDRPQDATIPSGWFACELGTTPDILPGFWGVYQAASEGESYVGLISRDDGTWESIGQRLPEPLKVKECYAFSIDVAHSDTYSTYNKPLKVRIWGGVSKCDKSQLLLETDFIEHTEWKTHEIEFTTKQPIHYILIEAYYKDGSFSRRGNILIDNISPIKKCIRA